MNKSKYKQNNKGDNSSKNFPVSSKLTDLTSDLINDR